MGNMTSSSTANKYRQIITFKEAKFLLGPVDLRKIENAFTRLTDPSYNNAIPTSSAAASQLNTNYNLSIQAFATSVMPSTFVESTPKGLANCLFQAFNFSNRCGAEHLSFEDFACALAVLQCGTKDQKTMFLFNVYDISREG
jgi:hypothetical protein